MLTAPLSPGHPGRCSRRGEEPLQTILRTPRELLGVTVLAAHGWDITTARAAIYAAVLASAREHAAPVSSSLLFATGDASPPPVLEPLWATPTPEYRAASAIWTHRASVHAALHEIGYPAADVAHLLDRRAGMGTATPRELLAGLVRVRFSTPKSNVRAITTLMRYTPLVEVGNLNRFSGGGRDEVGEFAVLPSDVVAEIQEVYPARWLRGDAFVPKDQRGTATLSVAWGRPFAGVRRSTGEHAD